MNTTASGTPRERELRAGTHDEATREPIPTPDELVARADALRPYLRERQAETEKRGRPSEETHRKLVEAGFYKMYVPRRYGGYEFPLHAFSRVIISLAQGCTSTAWFFAFGAGHALTVATFYSERVQDDVFGGDHFQAPHSARGEYGTIRPADGGWIVNGTWPYCSGVPYATHFMGNARILNADGSPAPGSPPRVAVVIVPPGGFTMLDDWGDTLGMRGTGSNSVRVQDVFVPHDYAVVWGQGSENAAPTPGVALHGNPLYLGRWKPHYSCESQSVLIGATKGALEVYEEVLRNRSLSRPGMFSDTKRYLDIGHQRNFGVALVKLASAEALMKQTTRMHEEYGERWKRDGIPYSDFDEELVMHLIRQAGSIATESMDVIFASAGTRAAKDGDIIQRAFRDVSTIKTHASSQFLDTVPALSRLHFGITPEPRAPSGG